MPRKRKGLGVRHRSILSVIERFNEQYGYPPSIREIGKKTSISSTSVVNYYLDQLEEMGYIERDRNISRGVRLLKTVSGDLYGRFGDGVQTLVGEVKGRMEELLRIPLIGQIVASQPVPVPASDFSYYDEESMVEVARSLVPARHQKNLFALKVKGDSMIDAMVNDGDIVIMEQAQEANNGDMVAVWLDEKNETTLKYFFREKNQIRLQPANPKMPPIYIDKKTPLRVQGKVMMVIRQLEGQFA